MERAIGSIIIGDRKRKELGDLRELAASIEAVGLLHPVVVRADGHLVAGQRRLEACKLLGWTEVPVTVAETLEDAQRLLLAEADENTCRKALTPTEAYQTAQALRPLAEADAKARQEATRSKPGQQVGSQVRESFADVGRTVDAVGRAVGVSGRTLEKIEDVVEAAASDPEAYGHLPAMMDKTGKVDAAYRKLRSAQDEREVLAVAPIVGKFRTIVVDPPWDYEGLSVAGRGAPQYAVMSLEDLAALPVPEWADDQCHLYLWATNNFLLEAGRLLEAWGFDYKTVLTWAKSGAFGLGTYFRNSTEHVLFGVRGGLTTRAADIATHFVAARGQHSEKPEEFYTIAERASYPPYLEAFSRRRREGWEVWGNVAGC